MTNDKNQSKGLSDGTRDFLDTLGGMTVRFWVCPIPGHRSNGDEPTVQWREGVAHRLTPGCKQTSVSQLGATGRDYSDVVRDAAKAWSRAPFPSRTSLTRARAALEAAGMPALREENARLREIAASAARVLDHSAEMLSHLVMDTPEDEALNDRVIHINRAAAAAARSAVGVSKDTAP